jgi:hypothetical protein
MPSDGGSAYGIVKKAFLFGAMAKDKFRPVLEHGK